MTAKRSPLDFIINDSTATEQTNKRPENIQQHTQRAVALQMCQPTTGGTFEEQNWSGGHKRDSYLNVSFLIMTRKRGKRGSRWKTKTWKEAVNSAWCFEKRLRAHHITRDEVRKREKRPTERDKGGEVQNLSGLISKQYTVAILSDSN